MPLFKIVLIVYAASGQTFVYPTGIGGLTQPECISRINSINEMPMKSTAACVPDNKPTPSN